LLALPNTSKVWDLDKATKINDFWNLQVQAKSMILIALATNIMDVGAGPSNQNQGFVLPCQPNQRCLNSPRQTKFMQIH